MNQLHISLSERQVADSFFADIFLGVMVVRGENLALLGESLDDGPLIEAPLDLVLRRQMSEAEQRHSRIGGPGGVAVDLGFLDDI